MDAEVVAANITLGIDLVNAQKLINALFWTPVVEFVLMLREWNRRASDAGSVNQFRIARVGLCTSANFGGAVLDSLIGQAQLVRYICQRWILLDVVVDGCKSLDLFDLFIH